MNNVIAFLAEQAAQKSALLENKSNLEVSFDSKTYTIPAEFITEFAEAIVQECCRLLVDSGEAWEEFSRNPPHGQSHNASGALFAAYRLKEDAPDGLKDHFGLE
jgi:hypothetical protein